MRIRLLVLIGALLLATAGMATAQQSDAPNPPSPYKPSASFLDARAGQVDFGLRASGIDDDAARYQRFRDLSDGPTLESFRWEREQPTWLFNAEADNVGYRDQRYFAAFNKLGRVKTSFEWDQVPTYYSTITSSFYATQGKGVFTVDDSIQRGIEAGLIGLTNPVVVNQARTFDTRSQRDNARFDLVVTPSRDVDVKVNVKSSARSGSYVGNANIASSPGGLAMELANPLDDRATDVNASAEWANTRGRFSVGYVGSWYDNNIPAIRFDNPLRYTDIASASSVGQMATAPNSTAQSVNSGGSIKLPGKSKANAFVSIGTWKQNEVLLPATINTALVNPKLERPTAEAEARIVATNVNFNSRPVRNLWLNAKYRFYDYDNRTPAFFIGTMPVGDSSQGTAHETEPASFRRHNADVDLSFAPWSAVGFKVGYGFEGADRTFRIFESTTDHVVRASADVTGNRYVSVLGSFEHSQRRGSGFDEELLVDVGEHTEMRHFDIADRDRNRGTVLVTVTPIEVLGFTASVGAGRDDYKNTGFGLRDNQHHIYSVGFDYVPNNKANVNLTYGYEKYDTSQWSRTANPVSPTDSTFYDARRDWGIDAGDRVRTVTSTFALTQVVPKTELQFTYDYSWSKATYVYQVTDQWLNLALMPDPVTGTGSVSRLPAGLSAVDNRLGTFRTDARYFLRKNVAIGIAYLYERYRVNDFGLSPESVNSIVPVTLSGGSANTVYLNYVYRPYTANTAWARMTYLW
jgi:MtrB/PioB family decaheme-associated outer membrane protein